MSEINSIAIKIISAGKGILAADESNGTMTKRLENVNVVSSAESRLRFRSILASDAMKTCIGVVILYDETIKQLLILILFPNLYLNLKQYQALKLTQEQKFYLAQKKKK